MALGTVNRSTLREQVLTQLRESILDGTLPSGTKMGEIDLAAELGVSRGTVREALRRLQESGLLSGEERTSLRVRTLSATEIRELFDLRAGLESQAAIALMRRPNAGELIDELETHLPGSAAGSRIERFERDLAFHEAMCRMGGNAMLVETWSRLKDLMRMTALADDKGLTEHLMTKNNHQPIVDALRTADVAVVHSVIEDHMAKAANAWSKIAGN